MPPLHCPPTSKRRPVNFGSANITTANLIGMIIYMVVFFGVLFIPAFKMHTFFRVSFVAVIITIVGMFIWAMAANHGAGNLVAPSQDLSSSYV
jgi:NCS1 family nucleobase:cation symporter-1